VSVGLAVYNGENYVAGAIESILSQTFEDLELIICDNASSDGTEEICRSYLGDRRVSYHRNPVNLGAARNYTKTFELSRGKYFKWAAHDDVCLPRLLEACVEVLDTQPDVALCHGTTVDIDPEGAILGERDVGEGVERGSAVRRYASILRVNPTALIWGVTRREILARTGLLGSYIGHDRVLLAELVLRGRFRVLPEVLFQQREHPLRSVNAYRAHEPERLIQWYDTSMAGKRIFPHWRILREHLAGLHRVPLPARQRLECYRVLLRWARSHRRAFQEDLLAVAATHPLTATLAALANPEVTAAARLIPEDGSFILVDDGRLNARGFAPRHVYPFLEKDGMYWGKPDSDEFAISELERLRAAGATHIVFERHAMWWFESYADFGRYLRSRYPLVRDKKRFVIFDLRGNG